MSLLTVTWLGTSSGTPTRDRNVSCLVVEVAGRLILLDAGEGAQISLRKLGFSLASIEVVCVTHVHGDHCFGLPGLLGSVALSDQPPPTLVADRRVHRLVDAITRISTGHPAGGPKVVLEREQTPREVYRFSVQQGSRTLEVAIEALLLKHRVDSHGFRVTARRVGRPQLDRAALAKLEVPPGPAWGQLQRGLDVTLDDGRVLKAAELTLPPREERASFAYLTDTVRCPAAIELARGTDAISHEATFLADQQEMAFQRGHSTTADALHTWRESGAGQLVLTHFSARNTNEVIEAEVAEQIETGQVHVAFDGFALTL